MMPFFYPRKCNFYIINYNKSIKHLIMLELQQIYAKSIFFFIRKKWYLRNFYLSIKAFNIQKIKIKHIQMNKQGSADENLPIIDLSISDLPELDCYNSQDLFTKLVNSTNQDEYPKELFLMDDQREINPPYLTNIFQLADSSFFQDQLSTHQVSKRDNNNGLIPLSKKTKMEAQISDQTERSSKKNNYPTKNFLAKFKNVTLDYIKKNLGKDYQKYPILKELKKKSYLSMRDYQRIFTEPAFYNILCQMFQQKVFYRALVISNTEMQSKKYFLSKIPVFEEAFETGDFSKIN